MYHIKKHHLVKSLIALAGFTNLALATGLILGNSSATAQSVPASSYQSSCTDIKIAIPGDIITAKCLKFYLFLKTTSIRFKEIYNNNGVLIFSNLNSSSNFQNSCTNITITGNTLVANCRKLNNTYNKTSILVPGIKNNNGVLIY